MKLITKIKKHQKILKLTISLGVLLILTMIKGYTLSECGFGKEFWWLELLTTLFAIGFWIYLWKSINNGIFITINKENGN
jgi:hypothetical protein